MINDKEVLHNSGLIIIEKDENGNIIRPRDCEVLKKYNLMLHSFINIDEDYYDKKNNKWYHLENKELLNEDSKLHTITYISDVTKYKVLEMNAQIDGVTNLYNRSLTNKLVCEYIKEAKKFYQDFSILLCDLDSFKLANDMYGHPCGDLVLKRVSESLLKSTRNGYDIVGRFGGDEFFILLKDIDRVSSLIKANDIKKKIEELNIVYNGSIIDKQTMSIGLYHIEHDMLTNLNDIDEFRSEIYRKVDMALYNGKNNGKNKVTDYKTLIKKSK